MESLSEIGIPSSTLGVQLTDRGARTEMSQPGFARPQQLLSCSRTSGCPRRSGKEPTSHLQLQCEVSLALQMRNLEDNKDNADILQHQSAAHLQHPMARDDPK